MIELLIRMADQPEKNFVWHDDLLTLGRLSDNDLPLVAENISGHHSRIIVRHGEYYYQELGSTNGSVVIKPDDEVIRLTEAHEEVKIGLNDRICLASMDHCLLVKQILGGDTQDNEDSDAESQTILAEASSTHIDNIAESLGDDSSALRCAVELSRQLSGMQTTDEISLLTCQIFLKAFPATSRGLFMHYENDELVIDRIRDRDPSVTSPPNNRCPQELLDRCMEEGKGFVFLLQQNQVQAIATMVMSMDDLKENAIEQNLAFMCCPLVHSERCFGFVLVEAPLPEDQKPPLAQRDLSLGTVMASMIAARMFDLEVQRERLSLARKATAGYLSAMVGHCFKNLLFVPMSISKMLPMCIRTGQMDEANRMLSRNIVNIRYLDILSNEFAAASKDPSEGFEPFDLRTIFTEVAELINQIDPEKIEAIWSVPETLPEEIVCHPAGLKRLLMNLTLNAVDAIMAQTDREEKGQIGMIVDYDPEHTQALMLHVRDNGPGMPEHIADGLREIYEKVKASADALGELQTIAEQVNSSKKEGLKEHYGLGFLFVCQTVCIHNGTMVLKIDPGKGTEFQIHLPMRQQPTICEE